MKNFKERIANGEIIEVENDFSVNNQEIISKAKGVAIGQSTFISKITHNIETMEQLYELTFLFEGKFHTVEIAPEAILPNKVNGLIKYGISFDLVFSKEFSRYLNLQRQMITTTKTIMSAGWMQEENLSYITKNNKDLVYGGELLISQQGTQNEWLEGIKTQVLGHFELELVLALALSTVFIGYDSISLRKDIGSGMINLFGDSSSGKSTSAILALSCFGEPNAQKQGSLLKSFSSTKNSMVKSLASLNGVMICFDDLSSASTNSISDLIYNIGNGKEKDRLTETSQMQSGSSFVTQVLVTGEESIEQYTKKNGGIGVRYVEFDGLQYTKSAQHSEEIKRVFQANYGFAAPVFADYLLSYGDQKLSEKLDVEITKFNELFPKSNGKIQRYIKRIAAIALTVDLIEECFDISLNYAEIKSILVDNIKKQSLLLDYTMTTLELVISWVIKKQNHFEIDGVAPKNKGDVLGEIDCIREHIKIPKFVFDNVVDELQLPSSKSLLKEWKKAGLIETENDRLYYRDSKKNQFVWIKQSVKIAEKITMKRVVNNVEE